MFCVKILALLAFLIAPARAADFQADNLVVLGTVTYDGSMVVSGTVTAQYFSGDGSHLTNVSGAVDLPAIGIATASLRTDLSALAISTGPLVNYANWDTAFGWGNHATAGYASSTTLAAVILSTGGFVQRSGDTMTGTLMGVSGGGAWELDVSGGGTGEFRLKTGYTPGVYLNGGTANSFIHGRLGLGGQESPAYPLDVSGDVRSTGTMTAVKYYGDGSALTGISAGDNLGNHTATMTLDMKGQSIVNAASGTFTQGITASSFTATGAGVNAARLILSNNVIISSEADAAKGAGVNISSNVYIMGFSSAAKYYGDGSALTGLSPAGSALTSANIWVGDSANQAAAVAMSGDATLANTGTLTLASVGTSSSYRSVTTDAKGRVTAGSNPTTFAGYGLSDTSANLAAAITDETGSGSLVFANGPTLSGPTFTGSVTLTDQLIVKGSVTALGKLYGDGSALTGTEPLFIASPAYGITASSTTKWNINYLPVVPRETVVTTTGIPQINTDSCDVYSMTALSDNISSFSTGLTGSPVDYQKLTIKIIDAGVAKTIAWGAKFKSISPLPTTTIAGKYVYVGLYYNTADALWHCLSTSQE